MLHAVLLLVTAVLATPPNTTLDQLDAALARLADPAQVERFRVTTTARYADEDGDDAHTEMVVSDMSWDAAGEAVETRVAHSKDGEPISDEELVERKQEREEKKEEGDKGSFDTATPTGEDLSRYVFGPTTQQGATSVASYEPAPSEPSADDLARGQLAWDTASGTPLWISFEPVDLPFLVKSLTTRVELVETAGLLHTGRVRSQGVGGPPLLRKQFDIDMRFSRVEWR